MPDLVIGCPIRRREWIVLPWVAHVAQACMEARLVPEFVFVVPKEDPTRQLLEDTISAYPDVLGRATDMILTDEVARPIARKWGPDRVRLLVDLRNSLLRRVRQLGPRFFLSLDSDILLAPDALQIALSALRSYQAVGLRTYMGSPGCGTTQFPELTSHGQLSQGALRGRSDLRTGVWRTDVIMAAKLMTPAAYNVDYQFNTQGEDVGWSMACTAAGVSLGFAAEARAKHVMFPEDLDKVDPRVGF